MGSEKSSYHIQCSNFGPCIARCLNASPRGLPQSPCIYHGRPDTSLSSNPSRNEIFMVPVGSSGRVSDFVPGPIVTGYSAESVLPCDSDEASSETEPEPTIQYQTRFKDISPVPRSYTTSGRFPSRSPVSAGPSQPASRAPATSMMHVTRAPETVHDVAKSPGSKTQEIHASETPPATSGIPDIPAPEQAEVFIPPLFTRRKSRSKRYFEDDEGMFQEVQRLIKEEVHDAELAQKLQSMGVGERQHTGHTQSIKLSQPHKEMQSIHQKREPEAITEMEELDTTEEIQPEIAAAIMHTEEKGFTMGSTPTHLYNFLFPELDQDEVVLIGSTGPAPLRDVVVPLSVSHQPYHNVDLEDAAFLASAVMSSSRLPSDAVFNDYMVQSGRQGTEAIIPPMIDLNKLEALIGAKPRKEIPSETDLKKSPSQEESMPDTLEYILESQPPAKYSQIQLRGSKLPDWFPGFFFSLPNSTECINISSSPSTIMAEAWKAVNPKQYSDEAQIIINNP